MNPAITAARLMLILCTLTGTVIALVVTTMYMVMAMFHIHTPT